jgi:hypothetical protein
MEKSPASTLTPEQRREIILGASIASLIEGSHGREPIAWTSMQPTQQRAYYAYIHFKEQSSVKQ